jgi:hypothetical protein
VAAKLTALDGIKQFLLKLYIALIVGQWGINNFFVYFANE